MMNNLNKFEIDDNEILITETEMDESGSFSRINDELNGKPNHLLTDIGTSNREENVKNINNSYSFTITSSHMHKRKTEKKEKFRKYNDFINKIIKISETEWSEIELINYVHKTAESINTLLSREEKKRNFGEVVNLSHLMAMLYKKASDILYEIGSEDGSKYAVYSSFWSLKSNLTNKES